jgi:hypothetical protein
MAQKQSDVIRWIETKDTSNPRARAYNEIAEGGMSDWMHPQGHEMPDGKQAALWKTASFSSARPSEATLT